MSLTFRDTLGTVAHCVSTYQKVIFPIVGLFKFILSFHGDFFSLLHLKNGVLFRIIMVYIKMFQI